MTSLEDLEKNGVLFTTQASGLLEKWQRSHFSKNLIPLNLSTGCCALEMQQAGSFHLDFSKEAMDLKLNPSQSDLLIVSGSLNIKWASALKEAYDQMKAPKWVMAIGTCAASGAVFSSYATLDGLAEIIPVDVYVPGCPPTPDEIQHGVELLRQRIMSGVQKNTKEVQN